MGLSFESKGMAKLFPQAKLHKRTKLFAGVVVNSIQNGIFPIYFLVSGTPTFYNVEIIVRN